MIQQDLFTGQAVAGFYIERIEDIPEIRSQAAIFLHEKTGARVLHLFNEDPNNLFCICFRTPVYNNTGVPHILEHSVLAGSRKFPLKDPFKEMLKGSLQTFLNAITYPDKTLYPVSSQVEKDFYNLIDIYCDAVFNPLLADTTFAQEGWHFDLENLSDPVSIKGIVYNEMKGVFSDFRSHVSRKTLSGLFPDTTYYYESGGEPEHITDLSYEQFREFHAQYYHPSNSFTVLYGNIPSEKTLRFLHEKYLLAFERRDVNSVIGPQQPWPEAQSIQFEAPSSREDDGTASVIVSWLFGTSSDPLTALLGHIFSHYLFDNESSPMRRALLDSKLGEDLDDMCGFDGDLVNGMFCAGLRKTKPEHAQTIRDLVFDTLKTEVAKNLDAELLEGSIRQIEFSLREITDGGHFPYNLKLAERVLRSWIYDGDPLAHLHFAAPMQTIKDKKKEGTAFFAGKMLELLIDNTHHLLSVVVASSTLGEHLGKKTGEQAAALSKGFTDADRQRCHALTKNLLAEQKKQPTPEALATLPKLSRSDIPPENEKVPVHIETLADIPVYAHPLFTAGIVYLDIGFDLSAIPSDLLPYFPLYAELLTRCGAAGLSSEQMAKRISLSTGGITTSDMCATRFGTDEELIFTCFFHGKVLPERFDEMIGIFHDLFTAPALHNEKLLRDILFEMRNELHGALIRSGHTFAAANAASRLVKSRYIDEILDGVSQLRFLDGCIKKNTIQSVAEAMNALHTMIINRNGCVMSMTCGEPDRYLQTLHSFTRDLPQCDPTAAPIHFLPEPGSKPLGIEISSSVNYIAQVWRLGTLTPATMGHNYLLSRNLSTGFLWDKVRVEGGAYGGMAGISSSHPVFSCSSYRDPNLANTLTNFIRGLEAVAAHVDDEEVDQSVIGAIGRLDQPRSPHSKGFAETCALLCGRSEEIRQQIRDAILQSSAATLRKCAEEIIAIKDTALTILGSTNAFDEAEKEGLSFVREPVLENNNSNNK